MTKAKRPKYDLGKPLDKFLNLSSKHTTKEDLELSNLWASKWLYLLDHLNKFTEFLESAYPKDRKGTTFLERVEKKESERYRPYKWVLEPDDLSDKSKKQPCDTFSSHWYSSPLNPFQIQKDLHALLTCQ